MPNDLTNQPMQMFFAAQIQPQLTIRPGGNKNIGQPPQQTVQPSGNKNSAQQSLQQSAPRLKYSLHQPLTQLSTEQQLVKIKGDLKGVESAIETLISGCEKSDSENRMNKAKSEELDKKLKRAIEENDSLVSTIKTLTIEKLQLTSSLQSNKASTEVLMKDHHLLSITQNGKLKELEAENDRFKLKNKELLGQIANYKCKEAKLLDFNERLLKIQELLQTKLDKALERAPDYKIRYEQLVKENVDLNRQIEALTRLYKASLESLAEEPAASRENVPW